MPWVARCPSSMGGWGLALVLRSGTCRCTCSSGGSASGGGACFQGNRSGRRSPGRRGGGQTRVFGDSVNPPGNTLLALGPASLFLCFEPGSRRRGFHFAHGISLIWEDVAVSPSGSSTFFLVTPHPFLASLPPDTARLVFPIAKEPIR